MMKNIWPRLIPVLVGLVIISIGIAGYFFYQYQKSSNSNTAGGNQDSVQKTAQAEAKKLISEVGKLITLPEGEEPTVATVTDIEKLKNQPFFARAKNGDKVIIYSNAKRAILYDPRVKKIVDVAPINVGTESAEVAGAQATPSAQPINVVIRNGTNTTGLTTKFEPEVIKVAPLAKILAKENATKRDYEKSILVVLNEKLKTEAEKLAQDLSLSIGILPVGEIKPTEGDILIILGKDKAGN